jgi:WD40 repeat protein
MHPLIVISGLIIAQSASAQTEPPARLGARCVAFSPDGKQLAAGTGQPKEAGQLLVWNLTTRERRLLRQEQAGMPAVAWSPDGQTLAIGLHDGTARLVDATSGEVRLTLAKLDYAVRAIAFLPDGKSLVTGDWGGVVRQWDVTTGQEQRKILTGLARVFAVAIDPDGKQVLATGLQEQASIWDLATGASVLTLRHSGLAVVRNGCFSPDGRWVITTGYDGTTRVWDRQCGEVRCKLRAGSDHVAYTSGLLAVCRTEGESINLFDLSLQEPLEETRQQIEKLLTKLDDEHYEVRESATEKLLGIGLAAEVQLFRALQDHPSVEVRIRARRIRDQLLGQPTASLGGHTSPIDHLAFSPDGKQLASATRDGTIKLWDVSTRKEVMALDTQSMPGE